MINKKLKKLINNPKGFWRDSKFNPKNRIFIKEYFFNEIYLKEYLGANYFEKDPEIKDRYYFLSYLDSICEYAFYIDSENGSRIIKLCILANKKLDFSKRVIELSKSGVFVAIKKNKKLFFLKSDAALLSELTGKRNTELLFLDKYSRRWLNIEFWDYSDEFILSPTSNHLSRKVWTHTLRESKIFSQGKLVSLNSCFNFSYSFYTDFDVDLVFTWVNSNDNQWRQIYSKYRPLKNTDAASGSRFTSRDELKFALRSWGKYGNFVRNIYIVSNCAPPEWLDLNNDRVKWVWHEEIFNKEDLPTFSSHAIEANIYKIKGLSNYFIYSNDDFLLLKKSFKEDFFFSNGIGKSRFESYGNVNGMPRVGDPDYLNAARNSNQLIEKEFNRSTTHLHTHSPSAMRKDILIEMAQKYESHFQQTTSNKFRHVTDISVTSYFYHHYAYLVGKAIPDYTKTEIIQQHHDYEKKIRNLLSLVRKNSTLLPLSVCINDGADSHLNNDWNMAIEKFLTDLFPEKSQFEK